ncbi:hypothetical protein BD769DRAFT_1392652 [Suillus cothurnatus]|nr:hypothetical protein BD769DRAFT_1392652 [Suillus cothurnatus]
MPPHKPTSKQVKTSVPLPPHGKKLEKQKKRALKVTYQDNPDVFEREPSELLSDSNRDEDTMFSDHALQTKLSNTRVLAFSVGKIPPASHNTSGSARKPKAPQDNPLSTLDDTSDKFSDSSELTNQSQPKAGAGQLMQSPSRKKCLLLGRPNDRLTQKMPWQCSHHHMKAADFEADSKDILVTVTSIFCCLIVTQAPFPDSIAVKTKLGKEAWHEACQMKGTNVKLTPLAVKMLLKCTSHVCGELKTKM